jgi:hypothetical protein
MMCDDEPSDASCSKYGLTKYIVVVTKVGPLCWRLGMEQEISMDNVYICIELHVVINNTHYGSRTYKYVVAGVFTSENWL